MIHSDWHIHSEYSYDASLPLDTLIKTATEQGLYKFGVTDHANFNDEKFMADLRASAENVTIASKAYPSLILGVELTPVPKPEIDYIAVTKTRDGYVPPVSDRPYEMEMAATKKELTALGVRYAIGASHWRADIFEGKKHHNDLDSCIKEWYRQQMWLAQDERVTILGHPWYIDNSLWYEDFSVIPHSMNADIAAAVKENGKYVECNSHFFTCERASERFRHQYAEFLRELFETGIRITYGSDCHGGRDGVYGDARPTVEKYLAVAGFRDGDISEISEKDLW